MSGVHGTCSGAIHGEPIIRARVKIQRLIAAIWLDDGEIITDNNGYYHFDNRTAWLGYRVAVIDVPELPHTYITPTQWQEFNMLAPLSGYAIQNIIVQVQSSAATDPNYIQAATQAASDYKNRQTAIQLTQWLSENWLLIVALIVTAIIVFLILKRRGLL